jgi:hypothetical protein
MLKRKTSLRAYAPLRRKQPLRAQPHTPRHRPAFYVDLEYLAWLRTQPCRATGLSKRIVAHHARHDANGASLGRNLKDDRRAISLNWQVHQDRHAGRGFFRGMRRHEIHEWEDLWIERQRAEYLAWKAKQEATPPTGRESFAFTNSKRS